MAKEFKVAFGSVTNIAPSTASSGNETNGKIQEPSQYLSKWHDILKHFLKIWHYIIFWYYGFKCLINQLFTKKQTFGSQEIGNQTGKVAVITGGTQGIGLEVAKMLLIADMHVIIGCRNPQKGQEIARTIRESEITTGKVEYLHLDLESLNSVRLFVKKIAGRQIPIDLLINDAAILYTPYKTTVDGFETQFQVNYLAHFLLTNLLLPLLAEAGTDDRYSRVVNVSASAQDHAVLNFQDLNSRDYFSLYQNFGRTKLAQVMSSNYLNNKCKLENLKVCSYAVSPGGTFTKMHEKMPGYKVMQFMMKVAMQTPAQAAQKVLHAAFSPDLEKNGGIYLHNFKIQPLKGQAINEAEQEKLWNLSQKMCSNASIKWDGKSSSPLVDVTAVEIN